MNAKRLLPLVVLLFPGGTIALGIFYFVRRNRQKAADLSALTAKLRAGLSAANVTRTAGDGSAYADDLAAAAIDTAPDALGAERWAFFLAGMVSRESLWGALLKPRGPNGVGDFGHGRGLGQVDDRDRSDKLNAQLEQLGDEYAPAIERELERTKRRLEHIESGDWTDPTKHLAFVAAYARDYYDAVGDVAGEDLEERLHLTAAAYNAGEVAVRQALAGGADADTRTTGRDYGADVLRRGEQFTEAAA